MNRLTAKVNKKVSRKITNDWGEGQGVPATEDIAPAFAIQKKMEP